MITIDGKQIKLQIWDTVSIAELCLYDYTADEFGKNSCPVLDIEHLSCLVALCDVTFHSCKELMCCFMFGLHVVWVIVAFWPILLDLCQGHLTQVQPTFRVYGCWNVKLTGCIIDQGFSPFCILYPISHFVQKEISPSLSVSFPGKFNILLINGCSYCVTLSHDPPVEKHYCICVEHRPHSPHMLP